MNELREFAEFAWPADDAMPHVPEPFRRILKRDDGVLFLPLIAVSADRMRTFGVQNKGEHLTADDVVMDGGHCFLSESLVVGLSSTPDSMNRLIDKLRDITEALDAATASA